MKPMTTLSTRYCFHYDHTNENFFDNIIVSAILGAPKIIMVVYNPYSNENLAREKAARRAQGEAWQHTKNVESTLERLMNSQNQWTLQGLMNVQRKEKTKVLERKKDVTRKYRGKRAAMARAEKASGKRKNDVQEEEQ